MTARTGTGLGRFLQPRLAEERCELCATALPPEHRHLVDRTARSLCCACPPCTLLFDGERAAGGRFAAVPDRYLVDPNFSLEPARWASLGIPVGVAFFLRNSTLQRTVALYPSPAGATETQLDDDAWESAFEGCALAGLLRWDVEALLVHGAGENEASRQSCHLVPVDRAYALVGQLRTHWRGFDGGSEAHAALTAFFADLDARARPAPAATGGPR